MKLYSEWTLTLEAKMFYISLQPEIFSRQMLQWLYNTTWMKMEHFRCAHKIPNHSSAQNSIILKEESTKIPIDF